MSNPLWVLTDGQHQMTAALHGGLLRGWELHLSHDGGVGYRERRPTKVEAQGLADEWRSIFLDKGWSPVLPGIAHES